MTESPYFKAETFNLPEDVFTALKNVVFTEVEDTVVEFYQVVEMKYNYNTAGKRIAPFSGLTTKARIKTVKRMQGQYGLNLLNNMINEFDFIYEGQGENDEFIFFKPEINFSLNGTPYTIESQAFVIYKENGKWIKKDETTPKFVYGTKEYTVDEVALMLTITPDSLLSKLGRKEIGTERDPKTNITSILSHIEKQDGVYMNKTMINGVHWNEIVSSGKLTCYNKPCPGYVFRWKCFNGNPTGVWGADWVIDRVEKTDTNAISISISDDKVNLDNKFAVLELQLEELPAQGKNFSTEGYYDLKNDTNILRLPRKSVS